jgi:dolichol-phosphate mannosyltransferase
MTTANRFMIDICTPCFNEEEGITEFLAQISTVISELNQDYNDVQLFLVDDGSTDNTQRIILETKFDFPVRVLSLSRNFGHQAAVWAAISESRTKSAIIVLDADLQDPPKEIFRIVEEMKTSSDVILMQRVSRNDSFLKKLFSNLYYWLLKNISGRENGMNAGDFYGLSTKAKKSLLQHHESVKYLRGLIGQLGFSKTILTYNRNARHAGKTHYSISKMFSLAVAGITGFSIQPLIWVVYSAILGAMISLGGAGYVIWLKVTQNHLLQPGWAFLSISLLSLSALQLIGLASIALYMARSIQELKNRPTYISSQIFYARKGGVFHEV